DVIGLRARALDLGADDPLGHLDVQVLAFARVRSSPIQPGTDGEAVQDLDPALGPPARSELATLRLGLDSPLGLPPLPLRVRPPPVPAWVPWPPAPCHVDEPQELSVYRNVPSPRQTIGGERLELDDRAPARLGQEPLNSHPPPRRSGNSSRPASGWSAAVPIHP